MGYAGRSLIKVNVYQLMGFRIGRWSSAPVATTNVIGLPVTHSGLDIPFRALGQTVAFQLDGAEIVVLALEFGSHECDAALVADTGEPYCFDCGIGEPCVGDCGAAEPCVCDGGAGEPCVCDGGAAEPCVCDGGAAEPCVCDGGVGEPCVCDGGVDE